MKILLTLLLLLTVSCSEDVTSKAIIRNTVGNSVVRIFGKNSMGMMSGGTGFSVQAESGKKYILTNKHICSLADKSGSLIVEIPGKARRYKRRIIEISSRHDLCLVESLPTFRNALRVAEKVAAGDKIFVVGHPKLFALTVAEGEYIEEAKIMLVMSKWRIQPVVVKVPFRVTAGNYLRLTPFAASRFNVYSRGGNSGSPIVNKYGEVISVLFAGNPRDVMETYGVPLEYVREFIRGY